MSNPTDTTKLVESLRKIAAKPMAEFKDVAPGVRYQLRRAADTLASANEMNERLREALASTPCFGCGVRFGDNHAIAVRIARGCVTCGTRRALLQSLPNKGDGSDG